MIVRIFRVRVLAGKQAEWQARVEAHSIPWMARQEGVIAFYPGKPLAEGAGEGVAGGSHEFSMTSIWQDVDSISRAVGKDWQQAVLLADEADLVEEVEMQHYETFG